MWCHTVISIITTVLDGCAASIFMVKVFHHLICHSHSLTLEAACCSE
jgi:hypothetical protein